MNRQNNCYVNNAYSGYYDNSCEDDLSSVTSSENNSNADDNDLELEISDDNETFVDEDYYRHNNIDNRSCRSLITLRNNYVTSPIGRNNNNNNNKSMSAAYQMYAAGNCVKTTVVGNGIPPITSTPKKDITTTNHAAGSKSAMIAPNNQLLTQVRRRLDQQPTTSTYHHMMMKHPTTNNNTTSAANVALRRSKSVANIPRPMKVPVGISTAANSSFSGVSTYYDHHHYLSSASAQPSPTKFYNPANTTNNVVITPQQRNLQRSISSVVRRPSDISISSARPLIASAAENNNKKRNTAIISPIYTKQQSFVRTPSSASRRINDASSTTTTAAVPYSSFQVAANSSSSRANASSNNVTDDASSTSPSKRSWLLISATQNVPLCTLRTCAVILFITGALNCFLCLRITMEKGKSYELTFAFVASFAALCLGFPCFGFEKWQWLPNRNYVSGYIILCIFNSLQVINLWFLRSYTAYVHPAIGDIAKGALCGISALTLLISILGLIASYCCKFPPPDNRVSHAVEAFRV